MTIEVVDGVEIDKLAIAYTKQTKQPTAIFRAELNKMLRCQKYIL